MSTVKIIIANHHKQGIGYPIHFGQAWSHVHKALEGMGAFSLGKYSQKAPLTNILDSAAFTETEFSAVHKSYILWTNVVGFETRQDLQINILQSINTGYHFLFPKEDYIVLILKNDSEPLLNEVAYNITKPLIQNDYRVFIPKPDSSTGEHILLTENIIDSILKDEIRT